MSYVIHIRYGQVLQKMSFSNDKIQIPDELNKWMMKLEKNEIELKIKF